MGIVENPALSTRASGNVCGINYTSWRGLAIARCAWTGTVPNTAKQVTIQGFLTAVSQDWGQTLSAAQRDRWAAVAKDIRWVDRLGRSYIPSGYQHFMKLNMRRRVMGLVIMQEPPGAQEKPYANVLSFFINLGIPRLDVRLRLGVGIDIDGYGVEYFKAGPFDSGGRRAIAGEWRFLAREVPPSDYSDFAVVLNKWYWYRGRSISEFGDVGNWFERQVQIA